MLKKKLRFNEEYLVESDLCLRKVVKRDLFFDLVQRENNIRLEMPSRTKQISSTKVLISSPLLKTSLTLNQYIHEIFSLNQKQLTHENLTLSYKILVLDYLNLLKEEGNYAFKLKILSDFMEFPIKKEFEEETEMTCLEDLSASKIKIKHKVTRISLKRQQN